MADQLCEGELLAGEYLIGRRIGGGAMGYVVAARRVSDGHEVAIKVLVEDRREDDAAIARFKLEARTLKLLRSPHVVRVLDHGVREDGIPYIVMEYLKGTDLEADITSGVPFGLGTAVDWMLQTCEGVAEAHEHGIVHRDLKPANLFLVQEPGGETTIKVLDFGISKRTNVAARTVDLDDTVPSPGMTQARTLLGSPAYMSPEQMATPGDVDARTDIWALGVTLFQLVTRRLPFEDTNHFRVFEMAKSTDRDSQRRALAPFPQGFQEVVLRCLDPRKTERYATVDELARALRPFASAQLASTAAAPDAGAAASGPSNPGMTAFRRPSSAPPAASGVAALSVGVVLLALGATVAMLRQTSSPEPPIALIAGDASGAALAPSATLSTDSTVDARPADVSGTAAEVTMPSAVPPRKTVPERRKIVVEAQPAGVGSPGTASTGSRGPAPDASSGPDAGPLTTVDATAPARPAPSVPSEDAEGLFKGQK
jgi:serine/threonine-protein kinase